MGLIYLIPISFLVLIVAGLYLFKAGYRFESALMLTSIATCLIVAAVARGMYSPEMVAMRDENGQIVGYTQTSLAAEIQFPLYFLSFAVFSISVLLLAIRLFKNKQGTN